MRGEWLWRLDLAWIGTAYVGWQRQPNGLSIQEAVETALSEIVGGTRAKVHAAGRTDAGVHALQQIAAVKLKVERTSEALMRGLNARLPPDIVCLGVRPAPAGFNPRGSRKLYRYRVLNQPVRCPFRHQRAWHIRQPLDVDAMAAAAALLLGEHDFTSFRAAGCSAKHAVRTLDAARVSRTPDAEVHFEFEGNGFLRHQVRNMVGTLVEVGRGLRSPDQVGELLATRDRRLGGRAAPAHGLWLVRVTPG